MMYHDLFTCFFFSALLNLPRVMIHHMLPPPLVAILHHCPPPLHPCQQLNDLLFCLLKRKRIVINFGLGYLIPILQSSLLVLKNLQRRRKMKKLKKYVSISIITVEPIKKYLWHPYLVCSSSFSNKSEVSSNIPYQIEIVNNKEKRIKS